MVRLPDPTHRWSSTLIAQSQLFIPTLRDDPADAEAVSHKLLVRGGYIRQVSAGVWSFLPLGWRVHQKVVQIIREEMDAIGGQEMLMPVLTPVELWQQSGRDYIPEMFRLEDRNGRRSYVLPMTHEETVTFHAREIASYRQLPQILYHFSIKERDEPRSRGGLLRLREFIMKDAYSFDRDEDGLDESFRKHERAYHTMLERLGIEFYYVDAESGMMGGKESKDFLAPAGSRREHARHVREVRLRRGSRDRAGRSARAHVPRRARRVRKRSRRQDVTTIEALADFLGIDAAATSKAMPVVTTDGTLVLGLVRGDDRLEEAKLQRARAPTFGAATDDEIREAFGAGRWLARSRRVRRRDRRRRGAARRSVRRGGESDRLAPQGRAGGSQTSSLASRDLRQPREGDRCPKCGGALRFQTAIEVGHIFKFGARYSEPLGATFLDEDGREKPLVGGSYGIGPARVMAAVVEQHHDERGIVWPSSIAPYDAHVLALHGGSADVLGKAEAVAEALGEAGYDVLIDDRDERPGEKFADADLLGAPIRVIVGRKTLDDSAVDVRTRDAGQDNRVDVKDLVKWVQER